MSEANATGNPKTMKHCPKMTPHFWAGAIFNNLASIKI